MKRISSIVLASIIILITGATLSYAAFPVKNWSASTSQSATSGNGSSVTASNEEAATTTAVAPKTDGHKGGGSGKSQIVALILCLLVGGIGIHRFYLGYIGAGVIQLLTAGGCGIWALIDLIRIITGDLKPKDGNYSQTF
jgi:TM2 domain-containing membrane protein YozV